MSKYTQPGDADAMRILQAEYAAVQQQLGNPGLNANDRARLQADAMSLTREMQNWTKRTGVSQSGNAQPAPASPPSSARVSVSGPAAAIPSAPAAGGIGEYVTGIIRDQMARQDAAIKAQKEGVTKSSEADAAVTMANNDRSNAINSNRLLVQAQAGLGPQAKEDMYAATMAKLAENDQKYAAARANYDKHATVNMMEDPLGWLWAQLNIDSAGAQVNQLAAQENILTAALDRNMLLSERAETSIQIDTNSADRQIADFQARKQLADGAAKVASLEAEGARASMSAVAQYGGELRKDSKTDKDKIKDEVELDIARMQQLKLRSEADRLARVGAALGTNTPQKAIDDMPPADQAEISAFAQGGAVSPRTVLRYLNGVRGTPIDRTAQLLQTSVDRKAQDYASNRASGNTALSGRITWKPSDDQHVAWEAVRDELQASAASREKTTPSLTDPRQDTQYNPLRGSQLEFALYVQRAAVAGVPTPVHPANMMVQLYSKLANKPEARNKDTGQITTELERAAIASVANMAIEGKVVGADGKPLTPQDYASMISHYYRAEVKWNFENNQLSRLGFQPQTSYVAVLPVRGQGYQDVRAKETSTMRVDLTNAAEIRRWLEGEIKSNLAQKVDLQIKASAGFTGLGW